MLQRIGNFFQNIWDWLSKTAIDLVTFITDTMQYLFEWIYREVASPVFDFFSEIYDWLNHAFYFVARYIQDVWTAFVARILQPMYENVVTVWKSFKNSLDDTYDFFVDILDGALNGLQTGLEALVAFEAYLLEIITDFIITNLDYFVLVFFGILLWLFTAPASVLGGLAAAFLWWIYRGSGLMYIVRLLAPLIKRFFPFLTGWALPGAVGGFLLSLIGFRTIRFLAALSFFTIIILWISKQFVFNGILGFSGSGLLQLLIYSLITGVGDMVDVPENIAIHNATEISQMVPFFLYLSAVDILIASTLQLYFFIFVMRRFRVVIAL